MKFLFLMDPLEGINMEKDTTFILMLESYKRKHDIYYLPKVRIEPYITQRNLSIFILALCEIQWVTEFRFSDSL